MTLKPSQNLRPKMYMYWFAKPVAIQVLRGIGMDRPSINEYGSDGRTGPEKSKHAIIILRRGC